jgi:hypothetical protein
MKLFPVVLLALGFTLSSHAQKVDIKGVDGEKEGTTTIEIRKSNDPNKPINNAAVWEVVEGEMDLEGDPATDNREARQSWKEACSNWKKEFRADNKENKIINLQCGKVSCEGAVAQKVCTSKAKYKIKTRIDK